jgi:hypothetical protein
MVLSFAISDLPCNRIRDFVQGQIYPESSSWLWGRNHSHAVAFRVARAELTVILGSQVPLLLLP